jgi:hypothetical protein
MQLKIYDFVLKNKLRSQTKETTHGKRRKVDERIRVDQEDEGSIFPSEAGTEPSGYITS